VAWPPVHPEIPLSRSPSRRRLRTRATALTSAVAVVAAGLTVLLPATAAQATPTTSAQINDLNNQIETVVEQYNGITTKLAADQKTSTQVAHALAPAQLQSAVARQRIAAVVRDLYIAGPGSSIVALMDAPSTRQLVDEMGILSMVAKSQRTTVSTATILVSRYQTQKKSLDALIATETKQKAELAAKKKEILAKLANLKALQAANASTGGSSGGGANINQGSQTSKSYVMPVACPQVSSGGQGYTAAKKACSLVWPIHWYGWGQAGPSRYDCSGLTMVAWRAAGVTLAHFTGGQWNESHAISKTSLRVGDLVFYNSGNHVAIYIGNGFVVQAEHTGEPLKESLINFESVVSNGYRRVNGT
jgi:cell wall-associated NlpC family hydrolase